MMVNELSIRFKQAYDHLLDAERVAGHKDFATRIGVSTSMITEIFKGRSNVGATALQNIVIMFDIDGNWLLTGRGEMFIKNDINSPLDTELSILKDESVLYKIYKEKDLEVGALKEEIGRLKAQLDILSPKNLFLKNPTNFFK